MQVSEYGTTNRPSTSCGVGLTSAVIVTAAVYLGLPNLSLNSIDVLSGLDTVANLCTAYDLDGQRIDYHPLVLSS